MAEDSPTPFMKLAEHTLRADPSAATSDHITPIVSFPSLTEELGKPDSSHVEAVAREIQKANWTIGG